MTVLVTGCAGFIGSHVAEALLARGDRVIGVDDFSDAYDPAVKRDNIAPSLGHPNFELHEVDVRDREGFEAVVSASRPERALLLAARAGVRASLANPVLYADVNVRGLQITLDALAAHGVESIVWASSSSVYGLNNVVPFREDQPTLSPASPYAATKIAGEALCHAFHHTTGVPVSCLRFFTVYGPRQRPDMAIHIFSRRILEGKPVRMFGDGTSYRDYTYIADTVAGVVAALDRPRGFSVYNLGCSRPVLLRDMIRLVGEACGREPIIEQVGEQPGDVPATYSDITHAREELGYAPETSLEEGVPRFVEWLLARQSSLPPAGQ